MYYDYSIKYKEEDEDEFIDLNDPLQRPSVTEHINTASVKPSLIDLVTLDKNFEQFNTSVDYTPHNSDTRYSINPRIMQHDYEYENYVNLDGSLSPSRRENLSVVYKDVGGSIVPVKVKSRFEKRERNTNRVPLRLRGQVFDEITMDGIDLGHNERLTVKDESRTYSVIDKITQSHKPLDLYERYTTNPVGRFTGYANNRSFGIEKFWKQDEIDKYDYVSKLS